LLVVVIIGVLATMSVSSTWFARTPVQPELEAVVTGPEDGEVQSVVPDEIASAELARRFACRANFKSIEAAVARKQAVDGVPPTDTSTSWWPIATSDVIGRHGCVWSSGQAGWQLQAPNSASEPPRFERLQRRGLVYKLGTTPLSSHVSQPSPAQSPQVETVP
jgi:hypothetical protein